MSKLDISAAWIESNMPFGTGNLLSDQESPDIALYINVQSRATFDLGQKLSEQKHIGYYNSKIVKELDSVESNFKKFCLNLKAIRGE